MKPKFSGASRPRTRLVGGAIDRADRVKDAVKQCTYAERHQSIKQESTQ